MFFCPREKEAEPDVPRPGTRRLREIRCGMPPLWFSSCHRALEGGDLFRSHTGQLRRCKRVDLGGVERLDCRRRQVRNGCRRQLGDGGRGESAQLVRRKRRNLGFGQGAELGGRQGAGLGGAEGGQLGRQQMPQFDAGQAGYLGGA